ncbi:hypothetical protein [Staphylococcus phage Stab22]|nr:hypothetical protein [Staphylococcus phage Stab22]VEV89542.1 hypothetical protein [Staphylococcus phage Stab22]
MKAIIYCAKRYSKNTLKSLLEKLEAENRNLTYSTDISDMNEVDVIVQHTDLSFAELMDSCDRVSKGSDRFQVFVGNHAGYYINGDLYINEVGKFIVPRKTNMMM